MCILNLNIRIGRNLKDPWDKLTNKYNGIGTRILLLFMPDVAVAMDACLAKYVRTLLPSDNPCLSQLTWFLIVFTL